MWLSHPWKCSSQVGWGLEQLGTVEGDPTRGRGWNEMSSKAPSNPSHSGIYSELTSGRSWLSSLPVNVLQTIK